MNSNLDTRKESNVKLWIWRKDNTIVCYECSQHVARFKLKKALNESIIRRWMIEK